MTIIQHPENPNWSIVLDNIVEITKGDTIYTSVSSYKGFNCINFRDNNKNLIQWDYGMNGDEAGRKLRDEDYERIIKTK